MNRLSYVGLFLGLLMAGAIFFTAGYFMCLSVNPPNGGIVFEPKFATASVGKPLSTPIGQPEDDSDIMPDVPQKSYVDRQALLARTSGRTEQKGLLERSQDRTYNNVKAQIKDSVSRGLRSLSQKISNRLSPSLGSVVRPLTDELPQELAQNSIDETFKGSNQSDIAFDGSDNTTIESDTTSTSDTVDTKNKANALSSESSAQRITTVQKMTQKADSNSLESAVGPKHALYAIRVRRFVERESALKLAEELDRKGYNSYVVPLWNREGHLDFEVRSGTYATYSQVQDAVKVLQQVWQGPGIELPSVVMIRRNEENIRP